MPNLNCMLSSKLVVAVLVVAMAGAGIGAGAYVLLSDDAPPELPSTPEPPLVPGPSTEDGLTLSFDSNGGINAPGDVQFGSSSEIHNIPSATPSRDGAEFKEWNTSRSGEGASYAPGAPLSISADTILYAIYISGITYDSNGGVGSMERSTAITGNSTSIHDNAFRFAWHTFVCWNTSADGTGTDYHAGDSFILASSQTLYAKWTDWTILNAQVGTKFIYVVDGELFNPQQYDWVNSAVEAANTYTGILGLEVSIDSATFTGVYIQEIDEISDTAVIYTRSGNVEVSIYFTVSGIPLIGSKQFNTSIGDVVIGPDGKLSLDGLMFCTIDLLQENLGDVYEAYENTYLGSLQVKIVHIGKATLIIDKGTMIAVGVSYLEEGKYTFTAVLVETNVAW